MIVPSTGQGALFTQQGPGTSPGYSAIDLRRAMVMALQEGVLRQGADGEDFKVKERADGANRSVDIAMPTDGYAFVRGDTLTGQGLYAVPVHSEDINESISSNASGNPRIDQVILEVQDNVLDASGGNQARIRVLEGTATSGATLDNRTGAAALPGSALLLADVLVANAASSIEDADIRDRRKWARGLNFAQQLASNAGGITVTSTATGLLGTGFTGIGVECSGAPLEVVASFLVQAASTDASANNAMNFRLDDSTVASHHFSVAGGSTSTRITVMFVYTPAAGYHKLDFTIQASSGENFNILRTAGIQQAVSVRERVGAEDLA